MTVLLTVWDLPLYEISKVHITLAWFIVLAGASFLMYVIFPSFAITDSVFELTVLTVTPSESRSLYELIFSITSSAALFVFPYFATSAPNSPLNLLTIGVSLSAGASGVSPPVFLRVIVFSNSSFESSGLNTSVFVS